MSLFDLSPEEFAALSALMGLALLPGLSANQQNSLGNFLMGIGQMLESAAAQQAVAAAAQPSQIDELQSRIKRLEERLAVLEKGLEGS